MWIDNLMFNSLGVFGFCPGVECWIFNFDHRAAEESGKKIP